ncbi:hypothetical protein H0H81_002590 [Sphagnurus paluster]|uniref:Uncharacterized protein n=1 Tax=Sphagnurus paluster TaxID=117069 RepID=A0A9P7FZ72_9AGAR|nr:hypothetical protein H0H81_002590 [Sphagnurus paluster]
MHLSESVAGKYRPTMSVLLLQSSLALTQHRHHPSRLSPLCRKDKYPLEPPERDSNPVKHNLEGTTPSHHKRIMVLPLETNLKCQQSHKTRSDDLPINIFVCEWNQYSVLLSRAMFSDRVKLFGAAVSAHVRDHARNTGWVLSASQRLAI